MEKRSKIILFVGYILILISFIFLISYINHKTIIGIDPIFYGLNWTIENNKVYFEDSKVYISAEPHTLYGSGWVTFNFTSKVYTGDIDAVFGFDTESLIPEKIEVYNPTYENITKSYTCNTQFFNYTLTPKYAYCYQNITTYYSPNVTNGSYFNLIFSHSFESGSLPSKTIYWNESYLNEWKDFSSTFNSINYNYQGMNKWWYNKDIPIIQGNEYIFRVKIKNQEGFNSPKRKYWFAIKPSSETIQQAILNNHFYALDPWTDGLNTGLMVYFRLNDTSASTLAVDELGKYNGTKVANNPTSVSGKVGTAMQFPYDGAYGINFSNSGVNLNRSFSVNFWLNYTQGTNIQYPSFITSGTSGGWGIDSGPSSSGGDYTELYLTKPGIVGVGCTGTPIIKNKWIMYTMTVGADGNVSMYINGTIFCSSIITTSFNSSEVIAVLGRNYVSGNVAPNHALDESSIWNRTLSASEVSDLWNNETGTTRTSTEETTPPNVTINSPLNQTYTTTTILFNITAVDDTGMSSCWYSLNSGITNITMTNISSMYTHTNSTMSQGSHTANFYCNDTSNNVNNTEKVTFSVLLWGINYYVAVPNGIIRFSNCSPDYENPDSRPEGQTNIIAVINATNNGSIAGNFSINLTGIVNTGWTIFASNDTLTNNLTLSTITQRIWSNVLVNETKKIWLMANCSLVTSNPGVSIDMGVT